MRTRSHDRADHAPSMERSRHYADHDTNARDGAILRTELPRGCGVEPMRLYKSVRCEEHTTPCHTASDRPFNERIDGRATRKNTAARGTVADRTNPRAHMH